MPAGRDPTSPLVRKRRFDGTGLAREYQSRRPVCTGGKSPGRRNATGGIVQRYRGGAGRRVGGSGLASTEILHAAFGNGTSLFGRGNRKPAVRHVFAKKVRAKINTPGHACMGHGYGCRRGEAISRLSIYFAQRKPTSGSRTFGSIRQRAVVETAIATQNRAMPLTPACFALASTPAGPHSRTHISSKR